MLLGECAVFIIVRVTVWLPCNSALSKLNILLICIILKEKPSCSFTDHSKATNTVWRDVHWYKQLKAGINGDILEVVICTNMYKNIKSIIVYLGLM